MKLLNTYSLAPTLTAQCANGLATTPKGFVSSHEVQDVQQGLPNRGQVKWAKIFAALIVGAVAQGGDAFDKVAKTCQQSDDRWIVATSVDCARDAVSWIFWATIIGTGIIDNGGGIFKNFIGHN